MAEGEISAVFRALAKDADKAAEDIAASVARVTERAAANEEANLARVLETDARAAEDIAAAGRNAAEVERPGPAAVQPPTPGPGRLEGEKEYAVRDPADPGRTITDIDDIKDGVLWEEKSATWAGDNQKWANKQVRDKLTAYLEARQHLAGYENAPIGIRMTEPNVDPALRSAIETTVDQFRAANPGVDVRLEFNQ